MGFKDPHKHRLVRLSYIVVLSSDIITLII